MVSWRNGLPSKVFPKFFPSASHQGKGPHTCLLSTRPASWSWTHFLLPLLPLSHFLFVSMSLCCTLCFLSESLSLSHTHSYIPRLALHWNLQILLALSRLWRRGNPEHQDPWNCEMVCCSSNHVISLPSFAVRVWRRGSRIRDFYQPPPLWHCWWWQSPGVSSVMEKAAASSLA